MSWWRLGGGMGAAWVVAGLMALGSLGCGSDSSGTTPGAGGDLANAGATGSDDPDANEGGAGSPVTPGDLVCKQDDDCTTREKPVCDQVVGCVACQYDWDCPAGHRCSDNECFEKQACTTNADCTRDALHTVCDAVQELCVGCREDAECGDGRRCEASECVTFEACTNSRDCSNGKVCNRSVGACVSCVVDGDCGPGSACVNSACVPTCTSDKDCLGVGMLCNQQVNRCVECLGHQDCPSQYFCAENGHCSLDVCEPGQTRCENEHELQTCTEAGDGYVPSTCGSDTRCVEDDDGTTASCEPLACSPGISTCSADGAAVQHCSADGLSVESTEPCAQSEICWSGACKTVVCTPNEHTCEEGRLYACDASGSATSLVKTCPYYQVCSAEAGDCVSPECNRGQPLCNGNVATVCSDDGLGPEPGGEDCATTGKGCYGGACLPKLCSGSYVCDGSQLKYCENNGTQTRLAQDCQYASLCNAAGGLCMQPTCTPNAFVCNGNVATRCKADGSGYETGGVDCSADGQVCDGGGCLAKSCTAGAWFCLGGSPQQCSATGATYTPSDTCSAYEFCTDGVGYCQYDVCDAGAPVCSGNLATTCKSDGSGAVAGGTDCAATQQICEAGACKPVVCQAGAKTCQGDAVYTCNANGASTSLSQNCSASQFCDASSGTAQCTADICTASSLGCNDEVISTCGANGGSWINPGTSCKASGQVCIAGGTCAAEEVSTQGLTTSLGYNSGYTYLSGFNVLTSRRLTKLETYASFAGLQKLTWVVYEKRSGGSNYDLVYQRVTSQTMATAGYIASPALDFKLEKGKSYALGVHITGDARVGYVYSTATTYVAKGGFLAGANSPYPSSYYTTSPAPSLTLGIDYTRYFVRFTTVVAP